MTECIRVLELNLRRHGETSISQKADDLGETRDGVKNKIEQ